MFYGVIVDPSKKDPVAYVPSPDGDMLLHISTCCLDPQKAKQNSGVKATLMVKSGGEDQAYAVCALREGGSESVAVDLALEEYAEFSVVGNCPIHLTGYFMPLDEEEEEDDGLMPDYGEEDSDFDMDMDDDPALLGYDASGLPIYDGEGDSDDDDEDDDDLRDDSEESSEDEEMPQGNVIEIKDVTDGGVDESGSESDDSEEASEDESEESEESEESDEEEPEPKPEPVQKKQKAEPVQKKQNPPQKKEEPVTQTKTKSQKFANGFEIHELRQGKASGKVAKAGKRVTMKYVGKLTNGKIFDQTKGKATFKFRLGVGEVIKGWDRGVEGMRVGDKRKLVCPPSMAYGSSRTGPIPPNSTLIFEVELVDVL